MGVGAAPPTRLAHLDGLRFLAVTAVILYHYLVRWTPPEHSHSLYPYGSMFAGLDVAVFGWLGVQLFFIISGFVIAMTLSRCATPLEFAVRRYSRLAPAMLFFSSITFLVLTLLPGNPFHPPPTAFFSSITFLDPVDLNQILRTKAFDSIDGAYWSLYVEVKFYVLSATLYFLFRARFSWVMAVLACGATLLYWVRVPMVSGLSDLLLIPAHLPWFLIGIGFYERTQEGSSWRAWILIALGSALNSITSFHDLDAPPLWACFALPAMFYAAGEIRPLRTMLSTRWMAMIGAASYSLYLVHQSIGVAIISGAGAGWSTPITAASLVLLVMLGCMAVSVISFRHVEQPVSQWLLRRFGYGKAQDRQVNS